VDRIEGESALSGMGVVWLSAAANGGELLFSALVSLLTCLAGPEQKMPAIVVWLRGSLSAATPGTLALTAPVILAGLVVLAATRWAQNVMYMGDEDARALGIHMRRWRMIVILSCTLMTSAAVCAYSVTVELLRLAREGRPDMWHFAVEDGSGGS
jgi:ABC-type Fe3+-siderophore transport system permease subunit